MGGVVDAIFGGGGSSGGGGGSSQPAPTSQNQTVSNIAPWAQPGVSNLINAASGQIFTDANQTQLKGYTPFNANTPAGQEWVQGAAGSVAGFSPLQQQAQNQLAGMQTPSQYGLGMDMATQSGMGALGTTGQAAGLGGLGTMYGALGSQIGQSYGQNATDPNAVAAYMNPYIQNTLAPALALQNQQFGMQNVQNQSQATQQGAFGGGRSAVMQGLNQQNQALAQNQLVGNAYNQAYNTANQNMQNAASLGMQGAGIGLQGVGAGLQGVGAQQAGYGQLGAQGTNLANIAGAQTQTGLNINAAQQQAGALQQQNQQNILNQAMANYNTAQTYPMTQLAQLESLYTGAPQNITSSTYSAAPSTVSQLANLGAGAYAASKLAAKGGLMKTKKMAAGGIAKFAGKDGSLVGGAIGKVDYSLENMDAEQLEDAIKTSTSPHIRQKAKELLPMAIQRGAGVTGAGSGKGFAQGGGIVAFAGNTDGSLVGGTQDQEDLEGGVSGRGQLAPIAPRAPVSGGLKNIMSYLDQLKSLGYGQPTEEEKAQREEIKQERAELKANKEKNFYRAMLQGAGEGLQITSPFANPGIGKLISGTSQAYAAGEKDYAEQLKALRSGELDLNKLSSTDRNNLLHYAMSGATSESNTEMRTKELLEAAKLRAGELGIKNASRLDAKDDALFGKILAMNAKKAVNPLTGKQTMSDADIFNLSMDQLQTFKKKGKLDSDDGGPKVGAKDAGSDPLNIRG